MKRISFLLSNVLFAVFCLSACSVPMVRDILVYREAPSDSARAAFNERYLTVRPGTSPVDKPHVLFPDSTFYGGNSLDDNVLPLAFGMVPDSVRAQVVSNVIARL